MPHLIYNSTTAKLANKVVARAANYMADKDSKAEFNEAYQVVDLLPESHVHDSRLLTMDVFGVN